MLLAHVPGPHMLFSFTVLPFLTVTTLLLDAAPHSPAVSNTVVGAGITLVLSIIAWLLNRTIAGFDASSRKTEEAVKALTELVTEMRMERRDDRQLTLYLKERQDKLEQENASLRNSFHNFDKQIALAAERKNLKS